jgi:hypothetical protein
MPLSDDLVTHCTILRQPWMLLIYCCIMLARSAGLSQLSAQQYHNSVDIQSRKKHVFSTQALPAVLERQSMLQLSVQCHAFWVLLVAAVSDCYVVSSRSRGKLPTRLSCCAGTVKHSLPDLMQMLMRLSLLVLTALSNTEDAAGILPPCRTRLSQN